MKKKETQLKGKKPKVIKEQKIEEIEFQDFAE